MDATLAVLPSSTSATPSSDSPAGIHCANPDCRTRAGERSRGHQSCRSLLCGHCCQNAARAAAEAGEQRPVCKVHARRVHTGHKPVVKEQTTVDVNPTPPAPVSVADGMPWPSVGNGEPEELRDLLDKRARLEQSLKRSLTMVVWYRNGCEPLRIAYEVTTFPLFQLQDFPELVGELGLQASSYIDTYNTETGQWEQHKISTVRTVTQDQRLLYRLRPSLLDSLTECPSLEQELSFQPPPTVSLSKRQAEPFSPPSSGKQARVLSNPNPIRPPATPSSQNTAPRSWDSPVGDTSASSGNISWALSAPTGAPLPGIRASPSAPIQSGGTDSASTASGSGNSKRWPTDYTVHEITAGFDTMAALVKADPSARQKSAFEQVFPPCRYVKSTVGRAKLYWKRASQDIKDHFLSLAPDDPRGRWTHFVHLMDGRLVIEVGKEKGSATAIETENETADEQEQANISANVLTFVQAQPTQPQISIQSPPALTTHATLPLSRAPPMGALLPNSAQLSHHSSAPTLPMTATFTIDRNMNINRSSSSLSGAMTIPDGV